MARIRTIKPEFFTSLSVASQELPARLTFIGLWTHCDDEGRCVDEPRLIKAALWPLDDRTAADVEADLAALSEASLITRYELDGRRFLAIRGWAEHQRINRPTPSRLPAPEQGVKPPPPSPENASTSDDTRPEEPHTSLSEDSRTAHHRKGKEQGKEQGTGNRERKGSSVPAVGGLTDRNARTREAPAAQPGSTFAARSVITGIPRYRDAPGWVKKHLAALVDTALSTGFLRDAIERYAHMVIAEARFLERQHIPELRDALRRLGRDVALGTTCPRCAGDPTGPSFCCVDPTTAYRPPTPDDLAAFERSLDQLGVTPDQLDPAGSV